MTNLRLRDDEERRVAVLKQLNDAAESESFRHLLRTPLHLGYERGDPAGRGSGNSRNGTTPKTVASEVGDLALDIPRDRAGTFEPRLVPKGARRSGGLDDMIISLYAGGMTVRDISDHLARTLGTELSHDTISTITDSVLEEVKAWQSRPLEET